MSDFKIERKVQRQGKKGYSHTVVIPKVVVDYLGLQGDNIIEFSVNKDGDVVIKKKVDEQ
jgi:antitoxin component of MazEF toxin-antitoxin module